MKIFMTLVLVFSCKAFGVEPRAPRPVTLDPTLIIDIFLHERVSTVLHFPVAVSLISGTGLSDGSSEGLVQFEHPKASRTVVLRSLGSDGRVLMQIGTAGQIFVFRLIRDEAPDSVVRLVEAQTGTHAVSPVAIINSPAEIEALFSEGAQQLKGLTDSPRTREFEIRVAGWAENSGGFEVRVDKIARSSIDDAIMIVGNVRNLDSAPLEQGSIGASVRIGKSRIIPASKLQLSQPRLGAKEEAEFLLLLMGDGRGFRANFSIKNEFHAVFARRALK